MSTEKIPSTEEVEAEATAQIISSILTCSDLLYSKVFGLDLIIPENMPYFVTKMWELFRLTNENCLQKFPNNQHIKDRNNGLLPVVNQEIYDLISQIFTFLIDATGNRALFLMFDAECPHIAIHISADNIINILSFDTNIDNKTILKSVLAQAFSESHDSLIKTRLLCEIVSL